MRKLVVVIAALFVTSCQAPLRTAHADPSAKEDAYCQRNARPGSKVYVECRLRLQELQQCFDATESKLEMKLYGKEQIFHEEAGCMESVYRRHPIIGVKP
jgi:hypothetical protein